MIRFLHTGDWQLGMTRHFFSEGVQERFAQSRFDAIRELGRIAKEAAVFSLETLSSGGTISLYLLKSDFLSIGANIGGFVKAADAMLV